MFFYIKMDKIKSNINDLKEILKFPRNFLARFFDELKAQYFTSRPEEKEKNIEIITNIESFEQEALSEWKSKSIRRFDQEIKSKEKQLNDNTKSAVFIMDQIEYLKYKIEKFVFSNKTIIFIDYESKLYDPFLLIVHEYVPKYSNGGIRDYLITRKDLIDYILCKRILYKKRNSVEIVKLASKKNRKFRFQWFK
jgi:hypothetical protein